MIFSILRSLDIYGTQFHFTTEYKHKFKTEFGGCLSIISFITIFVCSYLFSMNFLYKKNPSVTMSNYYNRNYEKINLNDNNIIIPFRIEDYRGTYINFTGILYPQIYYYTELKSNHSSNEYIYQETKILPFHECTESDFKGKNLNLFSAYCIDLNNLTIGGYWEYNFTEYFEIRLYFCKNGENYYKNNENCTSLETLNNIFNSDYLWYINIYYPLYEFDSNDKNSQLKIIYKSYIYTLSQTIQKNDRMFLKKITLNDDQGWMFNKKKNYTVYSFDLMEYEYNSRSLMEFGQHNSSSLIYAMNIYVGNKFEYITRNYLKVQDIIGVIGGLFQVVLTCFKVLNFYFNNMFKISKLMKLFFSIQHEYESNSNVNKTLKDNLTYNCYGKNLNVKINNFLYKKNSGLGDSNNLKSSMNSNHKLIENSAFDTINKNLKKMKENFLSTTKTKRVNNFRRIKTYNKKNIKKMKILKNQFKINKNQNENYFYFTFSNLLYLNLKKNFNFYFCCKNKKFQKKKNFHLLSLGNKYLIEICELLYYFKTIKDIIYLKHFFLNESQNCALNYIKKINLNNQSIFKYFNVNDEILIKKKIINYYINNFINNKNSKLDKYIFKLLDINMKNHIKEKLKKI